MGLGREAAAARLQLVAGPAAAEARVAALVAEVAEQACAMLGIDTTGKPVQAQVDLCYLTLHALNVD